MYARALNHSCQDVGRTIKHTKRKYVWEFDFELSEYEAEQHEVILFYSVLSGKRQIYLDGQKISSCVGQYGDLQMKFLIDKYKNVALIQLDSDKKYTLLINNVKFKDLFCAVDSRKYQKNKPINSTQNQSNTVPIPAQKKELKSHMALREYNLENDDSDEDMKNHIGLVEDRYINSIQKQNPTRNPQLFDGPIVKHTNEKDLYPSADDRFKSFGVNSENNEKNNNKNDISDVKIGQNFANTQTPLKTNGLATNSTPNSKSQNNLKDDPCPFFGYSFDSWVTPDKNGKNSNISESNQQQFPTKQLVSSSVTPTKSQVSVQELQTLQPQQQKSLKSSQQLNQQVSNISQGFQVQQVVNGDISSQNKDNPFGFATSNNQADQQRAITFGFGKITLNSSTKEEQERTTTIAWPSWESFNMVSGNNENNQNNSNSTSNPANENKQSNVAVNSKPKDPINLFALMQESDEQITEQQFANQEFL